MCSQQDDYLTSEMRNPEGSTTPRTPQCSYTTRLLDKLQNKPGTTGHECRPHTVFQVNQFIEASISTFNNTVKSVT